MAEAHYKFKSKRIMKKLKKFTIEALRREMPVWEEAEERDIVGGFNSWDYRFAGPSGSTYYIGSGLSFLNKLF
jgi:hypothetical protein